VDKIESSKKVAQLPVEFPSCSTLLSGVIFKRVDIEGRLPAIVMAPGMGGVKEGSLFRYAESFASAGFLVLAYDHINFGTSGGKPRQEADPQLQRRGYRDAITFVGLNPDVDRERIGIWGSSYSGGHVLEVGAHDRRVRCVVSQLGMISGLQPLLRRMPSLQRKNVLAQLRSDRDARFQGHQPAMIKAVSDDINEPCVMPGLGAFEFLHGQQSDQSTWRNTLTLRSLDLAFGLENSAFVPYISPTPLLMIVALHDELVPPDLSLAAYASALEPKKLVLLDGDHFSPYVQYFGASSSAAIEWFAQHLM